MAFMRRQPKAVFMAFGTKGDMYPIAAIAAAFACDQVQYHVDFISHSAHQDVREHLSRKKVSYIPVSSPPILSPVEDNNTSVSLLSLLEKICTKLAALCFDQIFVSECLFWTFSGSVPFTFCEEKRRITREHRQECVVIFEDIFGDVPVMEADLVIINFFA
ncbi:UDP-glucuronosyl/UDP-glucosyltransferase [Artemisia annua]|uniref:UDP-glucuronosyl/UDP-glucosyltransferase n=1 Tax=Artemisia annua TaxID=35608 RepID=A0A2U1L925_ARTAN|nr:UDP-glucuronosyl/UDP-glucosyltransferase [Artemisia annua]